MGVSHSRKGSEHLQKRSLHVYTASGTLQSTSSKNTSSHVSEAALYDTEEDEDEDEEDINQIAS